MRARTRKKRRGKRGRIEKCICNEEKKEEEEGGWLASRIKRVRYKHTPPPPRPYAVTKEEEEVEEDIISHPSMRGSWCQWDHARSLLFFLMSHGSPMQIRIDPYRRTDPFHQTAKEERYRDSSPV